MKRFTYEIPVKLGTNGYPIFVGFRHIDQLGKKIALAHLGTDAVIVTNDTLIQTHARHVEKILLSSHFSVRVLSVPDTEKSKSLKVLSRLLSQIADEDNPGKRLFLVLVGGGVIGDLGGVAAGLYKRGIPYVHVPTTLLAQVDSSIGGKTAVDLPHGKNLVGLFYQPCLVFSELEFLETLSDRQFRSGLSEVIKCAVIRDPQLFSYLERSSLSLLRNSPASLSWVIHRAVRVKVFHVERDEREIKGVRTNLNFGHTIGHALETAAGYGKRFTHGEAVSIGMSVAARISEQLNKIPPSTVHRIEQLLWHWGLPTRVKNIDLSKVFQAMSYDKKWREGHSRWVLPVRIGCVIIQKEIPEKIIRKALLNYEGGR